MQRFHQLVFAACLLALCWYAMTAVHELGHVAGAAVTGGTIERVVLYPLAISRTDVSPNPHPGIVVWLGPIVGCVIPLLILAIVPSDLPVLHGIVRFFAGFCLIANGAYISIGSLGEVGDCGQMLRTGTPLWSMFFFGMLTIPSGLYLWHGLGSLTRFLDNPSVVPRRTVYVVVIVLLAAAAAGFALSPR